MSLRAWSAGSDSLSEVQATGLERFELLGKLEGVDVFDMKPLEVNRLGTMADPIAVYSLVSHSCDPVKYQLITL